jgi:GT2 family glycosyltransferase
MSVTAGARPIIGGRMTSAARIMPELTSRPGKDAPRLVARHARDARAPKGLSTRIHRWRCAYLWLRVQFDAFRLDPTGYAQGVLWRVRGLRVRSRNRIAALAGKSPHAYAFWIACREPLLRRPSEKSDEAVTRGALAVIDCRRGSIGIEKTLTSIGVGFRPILLGARVPGIASIRTIAELANFFDASEAWICPLNAGDRLASDALSLYAKAIEAHPDRPLVYADDDLIDGHGVRTRPHFKPDWNPELSCHHDFLTGASMVRIRQDDLSSLQDEGWAEALIRRVLDRSAEPIHVPLVLHHRRSRPEPLLPSRSSPPVPAPHPLVTVIVPTRNQAELLRNCVDGLRSTAYDRLEIIVVDNDSDEPECVDLLRRLRGDGIKVIEIGGEFNYSALNNAAVKAARGEMLCFLNNDVEIGETDWLQWLVAHAIRPDVGAVGARLLYPDGTEQHAGVFIGIGGGAGHPHRYLKEGECGYFERSRLPQQVSAVTAACLVVSRAKFDAVGGFDETNFRVAFNDIDLCLKLNERGWQSFYEPRATLTHHESKSRGSDSTKVNRVRFADELAALKRIWHTDKRTDPFHHPQLSRFCEEFVIAV